MKKLCFLLLMSWVVMDVTAQNVVYSNLKGLLACEGDTVASLKVEKRTKNHKVRSIYIRNERGRLLLPFFMESLHPTSP